MKTTLILSVILFAICGLSFKAFTQVVNIPDANFKAALVGNSSINTNGDGEIQTSEAAAYSDSINLLGIGIYDLTGIEAFTAITYLSCSWNELTSLDVSANTTLTFLGCYNNQLTSLDVSANTALTYLNCSENQLTSLNVSSNTALINLSCDLNQLTSLNVLSNTALTYLNCDYNHLTNLNVSTNTALTSLYCGNNQLTNLDVSANTVLTTFGCYKNQLTSLDVSVNTALTILACYTNQLTSLDVSSNSALTYLSCWDNQLTSLNMKNGNNTNMDIYAIGNPNLTCINVDDSIWSTANWTSYIDAGAYFSENCYVGIPSLTNRTEIKTYPNPVQDELTVEISNSKFQTPNSKLEIINIQGQVLKNININDEITTIDLSNLASGLYTIKIITDNGIVVKKLIKD